jgi:uncharacterized membrane protein YfcA
MDPTVLLAIMLVGVLAGLLGALFGIGGGIIIVPIMTLFFGLTAMEAAAVSLVGIVATSAGGTSYYIKNGVTNVRLGLLLEIGTVIGSIIGAAIAVFIADWAVMVVFSAVIIISGLKMIVGRTTSRVSDKGEFSYHDVKDGKEYRYDVNHRAGGLAACGFAGVISSLTGVGGGVIKVPVMNLYMGVPIKAATATSNYMVGITAFTGAIIYFLSGHVIIDTAAFVAIGTFIGALVGSSVTRFIDTASLKRYFSILLFVIATIMLLQAGGVL